MYETLRHDHTSENRFNDVFHFIVTGSELRRILSGIKRSEFQPMGFFVCDFFSWFCSKIGSNDHFDGFTVKNFEVL